MSLLERLLRGLMGAPKVVAETEWTDAGGHSYRVTIQYSRARYYVSCVFAPAGDEKGPYVSSSMLTVKDTSTRADFFEALQKLAYLSELPRDRSDGLFDRMKGT